MDFCRPALICRDYREVNDTASEMNKAVKMGDGSFKMNISEESAISIDKCEQALLQVGYTAMRDGLSNHFEEVSKKKPVSKKEN
jgi:hypothetical protein